MKKDLHGNFGGKVPLSEKFGRDLIVSGAQYVFFRFTKGLLPGGNAIDNLEEFLMEVIIQHDLAHIVDKARQEKGIIIGQFVMGTQIFGCLTADNGVLPEEFPVKSIALCIHKEMIHRHPQNYGFDLVNPQFDQGVFK